MNHPFFFETGTRDDGSAPFVVLPVPYERTVSYGRGTGRAPAAILNASFQLEDYDEELRRPIEVPVATAPALRFRGLSDDAAMTLIRRAAGRILRSGRFLLSLGGEHSITPALAAAARDECGAKSLLNIDAHLDLKDSFRNSSLSHACAMRRARDLGLETVHVGARSLSACEHAYLRTRRVPVFWAADIAKSRGDSWIRKVVAALHDPVYVSVDIDGLDPAIAPETGTPEPGGMSWYQLTALLRQVFAARRVVAADIVETAPVRGLQVTEFAAARLGAKMIMYSSAGRKRRADKKR